MTEENKNQEPVTQKKKAPDIVVKSFPKNGSIDDLIRDNPGQNFVFSAPGASAATLAEAGLEQVLKDGQPVMHKGKAICRTINKTMEDEIKRAYKDSYDQIASVREVEREDKQSVAKKPADVPKYDAELK
jgi:hypothetical protein